MFREKQGSLPFGTMFVTLAALLIIALASACAPTAAPTQTPPTAAPASATQAPVATTAAQPTTASADQVELRMAWWGSQVRHDQTIKIIGLFQQLHPNIKVTYEYASFTDYWPKMTTEAAGGNLPDLMQQDYAYYTGFVNDNLLVPLDPYIADGTIKLDGVTDDLLAGGKIGGKLYALNAGTNSQSFVIDVDAFNKAGIPLPKPDWTWKDFADVSTQLHEKLGIFGNGGDLTNIQIVNCMFLSLGEGTYSDDGKSLGFTDGQPLVDYFQNMLDMQKSGAMITREQQVADKETVEKNTFVAGKSAMYFAHSNQVLAVFTAAGPSRHFKMVPVPRAVGAKQSANYFKPSMFWSVTSQAKHPKEAAMFIDFYTNSVEANKIMLAERGIPISPVINAAIAGDLPPAQVEAASFLKSLQGNVSHIRPPDPAKNNEITANIWTPQVVDPVMYGQITPADGVKLFMTQANKLLGTATAP
jgi:ABC-type glycerol-3-phosphate transport system substrate-binding protein